MGSRFFFNGKPCPAGHVAKRYTVNSKCSMCAAAKTLAWRESPEGQLLTRLAHIKRAYGLDTEQFYGMLEAQSRLCLICEEELDIMSLHVDHDHKTGNVRGLLCRLCNPGLGAFRDDPVLLRRAADYIERNSYEEVPPG